MKGPERPTVTSSKVSGAFQLGREAYVPLHKGSLLQPTYPISLDWSQNRVDPTFFLGLVGGGGLVTAASNRFP